VQPTVSCRWLARGKGSASGTVGQAGQRGNRERIPAIRFFDVQWIRTKDPFFYVRTGDASCLFDV
jgi:hypothetical protein